MISEEHRTRRLPKPGLRFDAVATEPRRAPLHSERTKDYSWWQGREGGGSARDQEGGGEAPAELADVSNPCSHPTLSRLGAARCAAALGFCEPVAKVVGQDLLATACQDVLDKVFRHRERPHGLFGSVPQSATPAVGLRQRQFRDDLAEFGERDVDGVVNLSAA